MNEKALKLNAHERTALEEVLAMDVNDMRDTHIDHIKARASYLTDAEKARFPLLSEVKPNSKVNKKTAQIKAQNVSNCHEDAA